MKPPCADTDDAAEVSLELKLLQMGLHTMEEMLRFLIVLCLDSMMIFAGGSGNQSIRE